MYTTLYFTILTTRHYTTLTTAWTLLQMFMDYTWGATNGIDETRVLAELPNTLRQQVTGIAIV